LVTHHIVSYQSVSYKEEDYIAYINGVANKTWGKDLERSVFDEIFLLTERHPYYMNVLCDKMLSYCETRAPSNRDVTQLWQDYIFQEKSKTAKDLSSLSTSQKKLLIVISKGATKDLTSKITLHELNFSSAAIIKSLKLLEEEDYIHRNIHGEYSMIDPLIKSSLTLFYP
jgi:hypothetical protein